MPRADFESRTAHHASLRTDEGEQLRLFEGGPDMQKLRALAQSYTGGARSAATRVAYACDVRDFERWCREVGRRALPATEETVCLYLCSQLERWKLATVVRRLAAIQDFHRTA
jgi:hypothetical protein